MAERGHIEVKVTRGEGRLVPTRQQPDAVVEIVVRRQDGMADLGDLLHAITRADMADRRAAEEAQARNHAAGELLKAQRQVDAAQAKIRELEAERAGLLGRCEALTERVSQAEGRQAAAEQRAARHMRMLEDEEARHTRTRDELGKAKRRITELERSLTFTRGLLKGEMQFEVPDTPDQPLEIDTEHFLAMLTFITATNQLVGGRDVTGALEYESYPPDMERSWTTLVQVIRQVREQLGTLLGRGEIGQPTGTEQRDGDRNDRREGSERDQAQA